MMKNGLECLRTGGFMARQVRDAAASGLLVYVVTERRPVRVLKFYDR